MSHEIPEYVTAKNVANMRHCPRCGSGEISNQSWWDIPDGVFECVKCHECGTKWRNYYAYETSEFTIEED